MSEEEKKAIEHFKKYPINWEFTYEVDKMAIDIILKLIETQQKEIEELKEKNKTLEELLQGRLFELYKYYKDLASEYQGNCVSKDKIKAKIEEYKRIEEKDIEVGVLQSLLEEE